MFGSIVSVIFINKPLNLVLFHNNSIFRIILKLSIKLYSKNLEKLRCRESMSYIQINVTVKCPNSLPAISRKITFDGIFC